MGRKEKLTISDNRAYTRPVHIFRQNNEQCAQVTGHISRQS